MAYDITLDGTSYSIFQNNYRKPQGEIFSIRRTLTGAIDKLSSGIVDSTYSMTLLCASSQVETLKTTAAKSGSSSKVTFIDADAVIWSSSTSGSGTEIANTGVYILNRIDPQPRTPRGRSGTEYLVQLELLVNATGMAAS